MKLTSGTRLGPYEILAFVGAGGMGDVYKARDARLDRIVAIKVLLESLAADPQFRERFDREACPAPRRSRRCAGWTGQAHISVRLESPTSIRIR